MNTISELDYNVIICNDDIIWNFPMLFIKLILFPVLKVLWPVWIFSKTKTRCIQPQSFYYDFVLVFKKFQSLLKFISYFGKILDRLRSQYFVLFVFVKLHKLFEFINFRLSKLNAFRLSNSHYIQLRRIHSRFTVIELNSHDRLLCL